MEIIDKQLLLKDFCARLPYGVKVLLGSAEVYEDKPVAGITWCGTLQSLGLSVNTDSND